VPKITGDTCGGKVARDRRLTIREGVSKETPRPCAEVLLHGKAQPTAGREINFRYGVRSPGQQLSPGLPALPAVNAAINPAAIEVCDGIDNNCNTLVDGADPQIPDADFDGELLGALHDAVESVPRICARLWATSPNQCGMDDGVAHRMDRLVAVGNGQVPAVAARAWQLLSGALK
jgi:hypothetical protein